MSKEIDQLDQSTAEYIWKWLLSEGAKRIAEQYPINVREKTAVRNYLRHHKLTPYQALEKIRKQNSSMPSRIF